MAFHKIKGVPGPDGNSCNGAQPCPGVWQREGDITDLFVQGYPADAEIAAEIGVPEGEVLIRVPRALLGESL